MSYTKGKWVIVGNEIRVLTQKNYFSIAKVLSPVESCPTKANADRIVKCVNSHDKLLEVCRKTLQNLILRHGEKCDLINELQQAINEAK